MEPVVHFSEAVAVHGRFPVLTGVSLTVDPHEIVLVQGPNGAGKTSLLRACAGLVPVIQGAARVLGVDLTTDRRAVRPLVGMLGHANGLYDDLSVADNVAFWGRSAGASETEINAALGEMGLSGRLSSVKAAKLSAGQRRRCALAAILARRPRLWLLDEPHAGLDTDGREVLDDVLRRAAVAGATVLFASHELDRAVPLADRVVRIDAGRIVEPAT
jgi:heme ABC exporter ATP-binding subunit CcmA